MELREQALPSLKQGEMLVRNEYSTLCRSDVNTYIGKRREKCPTILGHETVGRIEVLGPEAPARDERGAPLHIGDRVTWAIYAADPESEMALRGIPQKGPDLFKYGHELLTAASSFHGGLATHTLLRRHTPVIRISETIPLPVAAMLNCAVATVAGALRLAGPVEERRVLVSGAGMLGLVACAMAKARGARYLIAADTHPDRLARSRHFGVDATWEVATDSGQLPPTDEAAVDVVLELSGAATAMEATLDHLRIGGIAVWAGGTFPQRPVQLNAERLIRNLHTLRGLHNYNSTDLIDAVTFMERHHGDFPFADLVRGGFSLHQVNEAFTCAITENPFRVGINLS